MVILLVMGLLFVAMCVMAFFSARTVNVAHAVMGPIVFLIACFALVEAAAHLHWTGKWRVRYDRALAQLESLQKTRRELMYGVPGGAIPPSESVLALSARFNRVTYQRGRIWRWCQLNGVNNNQFRVQVLPDGTPDNIPHGLNKGMLLYAFLEQVPLDLNGDGQEDMVDLNGDGQPDQAPIRLPGAYLGEFAVTSSDARTVTLSPTIPLDALQQRVIKQKATWVLYETMPIDDHFIFADSFPEYVEPTNDPGQPIFGEYNEESIRKTFQLAVQFNFPAMPEAQRTQYADLLAKPYLRDGKRISEDEARQLGDEFVWYKVEFLKQHSVAVDATAASVSATRSFFNTQGLAIDPLLMRADKEPVTFNKGTQEHWIGVFPKGSEQVDEGGQEIIDDDLDDWIEKGICQVITPVYVRPLRGYQDSFTIMAVRAQRIEEESRLVNRNIALLQGAKRECDQQIVFRRDERSKLSGEGLPPGQLGELPGFQRDLKEITALVDALKQQKQEVLADLSRLHRTNAALREQLAAIQRFLRKEIDRKTAESVTLK